MKEYKITHQKLMELIQILQDFSKNVVIVNGIEIKIGADFFQKIVNFLNQNLEVIENQEVEDFKKEEKK